MAAAKPKIVVAGDSYGYSAYKGALEHLQEKHADRFDIVDGKRWYKFPHAGYEVGRQVAAAEQRGERVLGIVACGSGLGTCMVANKFPHVRAACATTPEAARHARSICDANVLTLGARVTGPDDVISIIDAFVGTEFTEGWADSVRPSMRQTVEELKAMRFTADAPALTPPAQDDEEEVEPQDPKEVERQFPGGFPSPS